MNDDTTNKPCLSLPPIDCSNACYGGSCDCSGTWRDGCGRRDELATLRAELGDSQDSVELAKEQHHFTMKQWGRMVVEVERVTKERDELREKWLVEDPDLLAHRWYKERRRADKAETKLAASEKVRTTLVARLKQRVEESRAERVAAGSSIFSSRPLVCYIDDIRERAEKAEAELAEADTELLALRQFILQRNEEIEALWGQVHDEETT